MVGGFVEPMVVDRSGRVTTLCGSGALINEVCVGAFGAVDWREKVAGLGCIGASTTRGELGMLRVFGWLGLFITWAWLGAIFSVGLWDIIFS